jgi:hypothetical protein
MKIVLTESQLDTLLTIEKASFIMTESLNENLNFNILKKRIKHFIIAGMAITSVITAINHINATQAEKEALIAFAKQEEMMKQEKMKADSIFNEKVKACDEYITKALGVKGYSRDATKLSSEALVKNSMKYNFDLPLLLAAAHLESCFGVTPRAKKTNSIYSVGLYDNGKNLASYAHPDDSISAYIELLYNDYLIDDKTINDLLTPGCFINKNGYRFASDKDYEKNLKSIRNRIIKQYPELA